MYLLTWYTDCHANGQSVLQLSTSAPVSSEPQHRQRPRCHWLSRGSLLAYIRSSYLRIILLSLASRVCCLRHWNVGLAFNSMVSRHRRPYSSQPNPVNLGLSDKCVHLSFPNSIRIWPEWVGFSQCSRSVRGWTSFGVCPWHIHR